MRHKLALVLANTGLLAVALVLLAAPLLLGQLLGSSQSGSLGVSQVAPSNRQLLVYPNTTDFLQYATFNPSPLVEPLFYQTSVTFTAFAGQQAAYNGLFTIYNPSSASIKVVVEGGTLSGETSAIQAWLTLANEAHSAMTLTTEKAEVGASTLKVADAEGLTGGTVSVDGATYKVTKVSPSELHLAEPLTTSIDVGQKIYLGAAYYNKQLKPQTSQTQTILLAPQARATITLSVLLADGDGQQQVVLPLTITAE
jgi:hypothetical protein